MVFSEVVSVINKLKHYQGVLLGIKRRDIGLYPDEQLLAVDLGISTTLAAFQKHSLPRCAFLIIHQ